MFIIFLFIILVGGGWLVGKLAGNLLFPKSEDDNYTSKESHTTIHNHITENHLHISKEDLKQLTGKDH